jgi:hypothetical protein
MSVAHYIIARPGKFARAASVLQSAGITAREFPAIIPEDVSALEAAPYLRFGTASVPRCSAWHGAWLSHLALVAMARSQPDLEWLGVWEEDLIADQITWDPDNMPADAGVVYLGGILWRSPDEYGKPITADLWQVTKPYPISGCHAMMIHRRAFDDILAFYSTAAMTIDDLLSCACMRATALSRWITCYTRPWQAWQSARKETLPGSYYQDTKA